MNDIHPTAVVHDGVEIGEGNYIGPFCVIYPGVVIGDGNVFTSHCSIGAPPQHRLRIQRPESDCEFKSFIGSGNVIREFVMIHHGFARSTRVGDNCMVMAYTGINHDVELHDNVTIANNVQVGGHSCIMSYANIGMSSALHQFSLVGAGVMLGMNATVTKKNQILPFSKYAGTPAKLLGRNDYLLTSIKNSLVDQFKKDYEILCDSGFYKNVKV